jgi:predicted glutamine amidotransferase
MCIVIVKTEQTDIPKEQLKESFDNNRDGSGYLFAMNGNLTIKKGFFVFNDFYDNYSRDMEKFNNPVSIIHFRITTHGLTNKLNCHPFLVNDEIGFAHNGMIDFVDDHKKKSDTMMFRNDILRNMPSKWIFNDSVLKLMEESIGTSKLAFLDRNGNYRIVNEDLGHWNKNETIWYSNKSYCEVRRAVYAYNNYGHASIYNAYGNLNITNKKKTKTTDTLERHQCRTCLSGLMSLGERKLGHCEKCQADAQNGDHPKRI